MSPRALSAYGAVTLPLNPARAHVGNGPVRISEQRANAGDDVAAGDPSGPRP
jgi:hypothetical protein